MLNGRNGSIAITANGKTITDGYVSAGSDVTFTVTPENTDDMVQAWQVNGSTVAEMTDTARCTAHLHRQKCNRKYQGFRNAD